MQLTPLGKSNTGLNSRLCWTGLMYVLAVPTRAFSIAGEDMTVTDRGSKFLVFGMHLYSLNPPPCLRCRNSSYKISRNSSAEMWRSSNTIYLFPSPVSGSSSSSYSLVGIFVWSTEAKQMNRCVHTELAFAFFLNNFATSSFEAFLLPHAPLLAHSSLNLARPCRQCSAASKTTQWEKHASHRNYTST